MPAKKLAPEVVEALKECGLGQDAVWNCHGTWVVYHWAVEKIAAAKEIIFDPPQVLEANGPDKCVALCVTGRNGDTVHWSIGEASPSNNKNGYPYAMAEKRAKDRVALKFLGLHGLVYSEDEADDFKASGKQLTRDAAEAGDSDSGTFTISTTLASGEKKLVSTWINEFYQAMTQVQDAHEFHALQNDNMDMLDWLQKSGKYDRIQSALDETSARLGIQQQAAE